MCGVVGLIGTSQAAQESFLSLTTLQHRGQDAAGILTYDDSGFHRVKNLGLVDSVFSRENMSELTGSVALGHVRYGTAGTGGLIEVQPFLMSYPYGLGMVHNGNLLNAKELAKELRLKEKRHLLTASDTEVLLNLFAQGLVSDSETLEFSQICQSVERLFKKCQGSYSVVTLIADYGLVAFRDPMGIRPLVLGKKEVDGKTAYLVASEVVALYLNDYEWVRDVEPGEVLWIQPSGKVESRILETQPQKPCMFEWIYFASPESILDSVPVYGTRIELGKALGKRVKEKLKSLGFQPDLIVPVPETSRIAAISMAEEMKLPYRELLIKNRYIKRTFILDSQEKRKSAVRLKLSPVKSELRGKNVILVDDSIVRGTTSQKLVELVKEAGANQVYFVSTCPPIRYPCFYGIDFPNQKELLAYQKDDEQIKEAMGADAVIYQDLEGLVKSIQSASLGDKKIDPCLACLTGNYPTGNPDFKKMTQLRDQDRRSS
ncbi:MAG: amidophosphoribosyltransferase [Bdellovibrionaceae bacterium]|nr:amidophosphoribosyltransferase [Pseudobdellovibrionaceae bacterium]|tara:strand:- start:2418 stop:3881 length:1464 start_codon:yes stop_codon:yes gene_type:complete